MQKKELVAQRFDSADYENIGVTAVMTFGGMILGLIMGTIAASMVSGGVIPPEFTPSVFSFMGSTAVATGLSTHWICNRKYLNEAVHGGKAIDPKIVKKHLTWKGRIALLPYVGKLIDPRNILSKDAPYTFVRYDADVKAALELDTIKDPMDSWDALMQSELGAPVEEALDAPKKLEGMQVA